MTTACKEATKEKNTPELEVPECIVTTPPDSLHLDKFYTKYVDVNGLPLISSWRVPDSAFVAAHRTIYAMTSMLDPKILDAMKKAGARVAIMGRYEGTTDLPEHHYLVNDTALNWDLRARGLGGTIDEPLTSCAEENVLAYQIDKYHAEDILVHEFAHAIHCIGIIQVDTTFNSRLQTLFEKAKASGILANTLTFHARYGGGDNDMERVERCCREIEERGIDITANYDDWFRIGAALASLGERGRSLFHLVSAQNGKYKAAETDKKFNNCLQTVSNISIGTFFHYCSRYGISGKEDRS